MPGSVPITLGGKERQLRFDLNALADLDIAVPRVIEDYLSGAQAGFGAVRALLWAGLKHEDSRLTLAQAGSLLEAELLAQRLTLLDVIVTLNNALIASGLFKKKELDKENGADAPPFFRKADSPSGLAN